MNATKRSPNYEEWLVYPAYPQHSFSLWGLVHICIPQTGTPCGRVMGNWSYWLSWALPFGVAVPSPLEFIVPQTFRFVNTFFYFFLQGGGCALTITCGSLSALDVGCSLTQVRPVPLDNYSIAFRDRFVNSFFHIFRKFFSLAL